MVLLWNHNPIHRCTPIQEFLHRHLRLYTEYFPAYAPELKPTEYIGDRSDDALANCAPQDEKDLKWRLLSCMGELRSSPLLL